MNNNDGPIVPGQPSDVDRPYATAARLYLAAGWQGPIPVDVTRPGIVLAGTTGWKNDASYLEARQSVPAWEQAYGHCNVGLWLPDGVLGIDVDAYDGKHGQETVDWLAANIACEPLPPTYSSTCRGPGQPSRIYLYRVPVGLNWIANLLVRDPAGRGIGDAEVIQHGHRWARVWPSVKNDKTADVHGQVYRWYDPRGEVCGIPKVDDCTWLPESWQRTLRRSGRSPGSGAAYLTDAEIDGFAESLPQGEPCLTMRGALRRWEERLLSSRHDNMVGGVWALLREGAKGHSGALAAIEQLHGSFLDAVVGDRTPGAAEAEWNRALMDGMRKVAHETAGLSRRSCNCAAYESWIARARGDL